MAKLRAVAAHCRSGSAIDLGQPSSRLARLNLACLSAASAAVDLRSHQATAVRFACPGWASPRQPEPQERVALPALPASEEKAGSETSGARLVWRLQAQPLAYWG